MTIGEKIAKLRRENNHTQEQLAQLMGVSRQSISKWESDITYPETEKIIRLSELYQCSTDYLLKNEEDMLINDNTNSHFSHFGNGHYEKKSKRMLGNLPLWHVCTDRRKIARGVFAIGFRAQGIVSVGLVSMGIVSVGCLSLGLLSLGCISLGLLIALGSLCVGALSLGAISVGILSFGAIAIGAFAEGALAIGNWVAIGDYATGQFAFGRTEAIGETVEKLGKLTKQEIEATAELMRRELPKLFRFFADLFRKLI